MCSVLFPRVLGENILPKVFIFNPLKISGPQKKTQIRIYITISIISLNLSQHAMNMDITLLRFREQYQNSNSYEILSIRVNIRNSIYVNKIILISSNSHCIL